MRSIAVPDAPPAERGTHVCRRFDDDDDFVDAAIGFLGDGAARGERLVYVADRTTPAMCDELSPLGDTGRLLAEGTLVVQPVHELYEPGGLFEVARQVEAYRELTAAALRDGYTGLRVAADATALAADAVARRSFVQYELLVDRLMASEPMSALCAYDSRVLGEAVAELVSVHPDCHGADACDPGFRAYHSGTALQLCGEVDVANLDLFDLVAEAAGAADGDLVIDLGQLDFIDARGLAVLARLAERCAARGRPLRLRGAPPVVRRCCELLGFDGLARGACR